ncbi:hypothetical protein [Salinisphaera sp. S4-8]|uniref:hypothetical protein n=1 Tax=Salinisphaera sp. S4-8 TaxID=633357 RepID=UPI00333FA66B
MEISVLSNWFGVLSGVAFGATWLWKLQIWLRRNVAEVREAADDGKHLATEVLDKATSPARRADIYAFIHFRSTEIEAERTRQLICNIAISFFIVFFGFVLALFELLFVTDSVSWLRLFLYTTYSMLIVSFLVALYFGWRVKKLDLAWQSSAHAILRGRAFGYIDDT